MKLSLAGFLVLLACATVALPSAISQEDGNAGIQPPTLSITSEVDVLANQRHNVIIKPESHAVIEQDMSDYRSSGNVDGAQRVEKAGVFIDDGDPTARNRRDMIEARAHEYHDWRMFCTSWPRFLHCRSLVGLICDKWGRVRQRAEGWFGRYRTEFQRCLDVDNCECLNVETGEWSANANSLSPVYYPEVCWAKRDSDDPPHPPPMPEPDQHCYD